MSTTIQIVNAKPNHLPVRVFVQQQRPGYPEDLPAQTEYVLQVGEAASECVYKGKRLIIEEVPE
jgi:hypothetical protein